MIPSAYSDAEGIAEAVDAGRHRDVVGGMWDEIGSLQFEYLQANGLDRTSKLIDIGCGCLRGGVHFISYLNDGMYFGLDSNAPLLDVGYNIELKAINLQKKLPRKNLICDIEFNLDLFDAEFFDFALAQSLFTHLPVNQIRLCLSRLARKMRAGGRFFATFFLVPESHPYGQPFDHVGGVTSFDAQDPFHYRTSDLPYFCIRLPWRIDVRGDWRHPRNQQMVEFVRVET